MKVVYRDKVSTGGTGDKWCNIYEVRETPLGNFQCEKRLTDSICWFMLDGFPERATAEEAERDLAEYAERRGLRRATAIINTEFDSGEDDPIVKLKAPPDITV